jgi:hypothetical protein
MQYYNVPDTNVGKTGQTSRKFALYFVKERYYFMAEFTGIALQTVAQGEDVAFTETPVAGSNCITHRQGSGIVKLRGLTNQCRARFLVSYSGNIQIPTGGTVEAISLAIAIDGEPLQSTRMIVTPAAVENFFNVSTQAYVDVPRGCCVTAAVQNTSAQAIEVQNSNLIAVREA